MNLKSIEARLSQIEARHARGETEWERRIAWKKDWTMRKTIETYGDVMREPGDPEPTEAEIEERLQWADEYNALPVKPTMGELLKEWSEVQ